MTRTHEELEAIAALDAIGAASAEEEQALHAHLESCEDCRRAREEYAEAATLLARQLEPVTPPGDVRQRIVGNAREDSDDDDADDRADNIVGSPRRFNWWLATAATLFLALWGWRELAIRAAKARIHDQEATIAQLNEQNELISEQREKLAAEMTALADANTRTMALTGQQASPSASARVFLQPKARRALVFFYDLPANGKDKSYQLWIIRADQPAPQSAGVFDVSDNGRASVTVENLPLDTQIKALAVTLEPRGGGAQPSNNNFYVMGGSL
jgi:anti-sigma-K factor RskA